MVTFVYFIFSVSDYRLPLDYFLFIFRKLKKARNTRNCFPVINRVLRVPLFPFLEEGGKEPWE